MYFIVSFTLWKIVFEFYLYYYCKLGTLSPNFNKFSCFTDSFHLINLWSCNKILCLLILWEIKQWNMFYLSFKKRLRNLKHKIKGIKFNRLLIEKKNLKCKNLYFDIVSKNFDFFCFNIKNLNLLSINRSNKFTDYVFFNNYCIFWEF